MMDKLSEIWREVYSIIRALMRLVFLTIAMFASGVHVVLFTRTEIFNVEMRGMPLLCDREKLGDQISFVDSLCLNNQDLLDYADEQMEKDGKFPPSDDDDGTDI